MKTHSITSLLHKIHPVIWLAFLLAPSQIDSTANPQSAAFHPLSVWVIDTVGTTRSCFDMHISLALNDNGAPHMSYYDSTESSLMHASKMPSGWINSVVDNSEAVGRHSSIAMNSSANPCIAYRDMTKNALKYANWDGSEWDLSFISEFDYGWNPSLVIDSNDNPHISYLGFNSESGSQTPKYTYWTGNHWDISVIDPVFAYGGTSLALDSSDRPHVSYHTSQKLMYAVYSDTTWITEIVDSVSVGNVSGVGLYSSIALDSLDQVHISYALYGLNFSPPYPDDLKYAVKQDSMWAFDTPDTQGQVGFYSSIALDSIGHPHISYYDSSNYAIKYIFWDGVIWTGLVVDTPVVMDGYTSLILDADDLPHVAYCDELSNTVKYARWVHLNNHFFLPLLFKPV